MTLQLASVVILLAIFVIASIWKVNMGLLMLLSGAVLAFFGGISSDTIVGSFPVETFILICGITYFFVVVESSRTMDFIVSYLLKMVRGHLAVIPFLFFFIAAATCAVGCYPPAVAALVMPVAMRLAKDQGINRFMMAIMVIHGILAGNFGPLATPGVFTAKLLSDEGFQPITLQLFASHIVINLVVAFAAFLLFGGLKLIRGQRTEVVVQERELISVGAGGSGGHGGGGFDESTYHGGGSGGSDSADLSANSNPLGRPNAYQITTIVALVALLVLALGFGFDLGYTALALGLVLTLAFERNDNTFIHKMPWGVILMVVGVLVYFGVLTALGTIESLNDLLTNLGSDSAAVLALSYLAGIISAFASSITTIGATLQLAMPLIGPETSVLSVVGPVTISSTIVDASPIGIIGALSLASVEAEARPKLMRYMLIWAAVMVVIGPPLAWSIFTFM